jgi:ArsR family metal-binding transcriptional regulator
MYVNLRVKKKIVWLLIQQTKQSIVVVVFVKSVLPCTADGGWWVVGANMKYENTNQLLKATKKIVTRPQGLVLMT